MRELILSRLSKLTKEDVIVAFSGGADSALLLKLACNEALKNNTKVYAVMIKTRLHPANDADIAKAAAREIGAEFILLELDELKDINISNNPKDRCYLCKKGLFSRIKAEAFAREIHTVIEGTNGDDLNMYRPGIRALKELEIISPLAEAKISKKEVRQWLQELGVSVAKRPSTPCLATRIPYGERLDYQLLSRIDEGENYIRKLGFYNVRLRVHRETVRIEVDMDSMSQLLKYKDCVIKKLKELGFIYITMDLEGFRSGSMDI